MFSAKHKPSAAAYHYLRGPGECHIFVHVKHNTSTVCRDVPVKIHASPAWKDGPFTTTFIPPFKSSPLHWLFSLTTINSQGRTHGGFDIF